MISVEITNYESIGHIEFDIDGFTTIIGRNFIGKSAVMRAINAALTNASGSSFIKWGEKFCEVRIKSQSIDLLWHKEDGNSFYIINNKKYDKIGKDDPPDEIFKAGLGTTLVGREKLNLLYVEQFFPLFLVDKKDSKGIDILTAAYGLDKVYKAIDLCNKDQRSNKDLLRIRAKDLFFIEEDLKKYEGFEDISSRKSELVEQKKSLEQKERRIDKLKNLFTRFSALSSQVRSLQGIKEIEIPTKSNLKSLKDRADKINKFQVSLNRAAEAVTKLKPIEDINVPEDASKIKSLKEKLGSVFSLQTRYEAISSSISKLSGVEKVKIPVLPDLDFDRIVVLETYRRRVIELRDRYKELEDSFKDVSKEEKVLLKQKEEFQGVCPLCGNELKDCNERD